MSPDRLYRIVCREGAGLLDLDGKPRPLCGRIITGDRLSTLIQDHATHLLQAHATSDADRRLLEHPPAVRGTGPVLRAQAPEVVVYELAETSIG